MYEFCLLLSRADRAFRVVVARQLEKYDLTMMEWLLLATVDEAPTKGIAMSGVAGRLDVTLPQITALANELVQKKFVKQTVNAKDRRSRYLTITKSGNRTTQDVNVSVKTAMKDWLGDLPEEQLDCFVKTVKTVAEDKAPLL